MHLEGRLGNSLGDMELSQGGVVVDFYYSDIPENLQIFTQNVEKGEKLTRRAIVGL